MLTRRTVRAAPHACARDAGLLMQMKVWLGCATRGASALGFAPLAGYRAVGVAPVPSAPFPSTFHRCAHWLHSHRRHPQRPPAPAHSAAGSPGGRRHLLLLQNARHLHLVRHRGARFHRRGVARVDLRLELRVVVTNVRQVFEPEVMLLSGVLLRFKRERAAGRASVRNSRGGGTDLGVELWRVPRARREFAGTHRVVR